MRNSATMHTNTIESPSRLFSSLAQYCRFTPRSENLTYFGEYFAHAA